MKRQSLILRKIQFSNQQSGKISVWNKSEAPFLFTFCSFFFFFFCFLVVISGFVKARTSLTHFRLNKLPHNIHSVSVFYVVNHIYILEESNFNFKYVRICDYDIPRKKIAIIVAANNGDPDQTPHSDLVSRLKLVETVLARQFQ